MAIKALVFSQEDGVRLQERKTVEESAEAIVAVSLAGICSTDLEILKGYVPGYNHVLGHEFVGVVEACNDRPELVGQRVVAEINCPLDDQFSDPDPVFMRNHYPRRTVLGIIGRDGAMAQQLQIPAANLHVVPGSVSDREAVFAEPLAAACRVLEQQVIKQQDRVAIVGDGKLGLLVAQLIALQTKTPPLHFGRHQSKLDLVEGTQKVVVSGDGDLADEHKQAFDVCVEATGSARGILMAVALTRPLGTVVQKSTCSMEQDLPPGEKMPVWSEIANSIVVDEKRMVGSRCGPFEPAIQALQSPVIKALLAKMITAVYPIADGLEAIEKAKSKGCLKVLIDMKA